MPLDPSIILGIKPAQDPLQSYGNALAVANQVNQNKLAQLQFQQAEREQARQNKLSELLSAQYATPDAREEALMRGGFVDQSLKLGKDRREGVKLDNESMKAQREAEAAQFKLALDKTTAMLQYLSAAKDQPSYDIARQNAAALGLDISSAPAQFDPAYVASVGQQAMTMKDRLEAEARNRGYDLQAARDKEAARHNTEQEKNAAGNLAVAQSNLGLRRKELETNQNVYDTERGILVNKGTGAARPAMNADGTPVGPKDKNLTEGQAKANLFGTRMQEANKILAGLAENGTTTSIPGSRAPYIGGVINAVQSADLQSLDQAKRDFINAALRRESGAVIADSEFANAEKQYFPQPGDSEQVIKQKARNRQIAIEGVLSEVPENRRGVPASRQSLPGAPVRNQKTGNASVADNDPLGLRK